VSDIAIPVPLDVQIEAAAQALARGEVVAFPTETVYGLGADAVNPDAVRRVFALKGRPATHPLIVHLAGEERLDRWARDLPGAAHRLARRFWPGPLTLILRAREDIDRTVTGGQDTVGLRVPSHPVAQALLQAFGRCGSGAIAAPSANRFGRLSATRAWHVRAEFGDAIAQVLDGGACTIGVESTIVDLSTGRPVLLRPGSIGPAALAEVLGEWPAAPGANAPRASGTLASHYAPRAVVMLVEGDLLVEVARILQSEGRRVAALAREARQPLLPGLRWQVLPLDPEGYARALYDALRTLDEDGADVIVVERPPPLEAWLAVGDRLQRAAAERPRPRQVAPPADVDRSP